MRTDLGDAPDRLYQHCGEVPVLLRQIIGRDRFVVILFVRRLEEFLVSAYPQTLRLGETMSFPQYLSGLDLFRLPWMPTARERVGAPADQRLAIGPALPGGTHAEPRLPRLLRIVVALLDLRAFPGMRPARLMDAAPASRLAARYAQDLADSAALGAPRWMCWWRCRPRQGRRDRAAVACPASWCEGRRCQERARCWTRRLPCGGPGCEAGMAAGVIWATVWAWP